MIAASGATGLGRVSLGRGPDRPYERDLSIHAVFAARAGERAASEAAVAHDGRVSYAELEARASRIAAALARAGVEPGAAVGVSLERSIALPAVLLGILKAGAAYVALDAAYPEERLAFIARDAALALIITDPQAPAHLLNLGVPAIDVAAAEASVDLTARHEVRRSATDVAYIAYTSGSTGRPKGVAVRHRGVVRLVRSTDYIDVGPDDTFLQFAPVAFDASTLEIWGPLLCGGRLALAPPHALAIDDIASAVETSGVTMMWLTTALFQRMVDTASPGFADLRTMLTGGDVASPSHVRRFLRAYPGCRLINGYGPTENTTFSTTHAIEALAEDELRVPIGRPIAHSSAYVLDDAGEPAPFGTTGELYVGGDGVAAGYVGLPELTAERFLPDPFAGEPDARMYRTGDRACMREDGTIEFFGRTDDQVKIRGYRIELGEIEATLRSHPGLRDAAVVAGEMSGEKTLVAYVVPAAAGRDDERTLRAYLTERLPRYMVPHRIVVTPSLPSHPSGKIDRVALARLAAAPEPAPPAARRRPGLGGSPLETQIGDLWCAVLGTAERPGPHENFFDAGGDSLLLLVIQRRLRDDLGASVSVTELFEHTTIRGLASFLDRRGASSPHA